MNLDDYWEMMPCQFSKYVDVYTKKERTRAIEMDLNNYNLGKYIAFAFHDPKKYPSRPFLYKELSELEGEEKKGERMSNEEMERVIRRNNLILGGTFNGTNIGNSRGKHRNK